MDVYKDGVFKWSDTSNFNDVDTVNGWSYTFYLPVFSNLDPGNWSVNVYLLKQDGSKQFLKTMSFQVYENASQPSTNSCTASTAYVTNHGEGLQAGNQFCDSTNAVYTVNNLINGSSCYIVPAGQTVNIAVAPDSVSINGQQYASYGTRTARVLVSGCYGYSAPSYTGDTNYRTYSATQTFRVIMSN